MKTFTYVQIFKNANVLISMVPPKQCSFLVGCSKTGPKYSITHSDKYFSIEHLDICKIHELDVKTVFEELK